MQPLTLKCTISSVRLHQWARLFKHKSKSTHQIHSTNHPRNPHHEIHKWTADVQIALVPTHPPESVRLIGRRDGKSSFSLSVCRTGAPEGRIYRGTINNARSLHLPEIFRADAVVFVQLVRQVGGKVARCRGSGVDWSCVLYTWRCSNANITGSTTYIHF